MSELWRDIAGFEGRYQVSDSGRILNLRTGKPMKFRCDRDGYRQVNLWDGERYTTCKVHRVVAVTFLGAAPEGKPWVDHKHGVSAGDQVSNLRWLSPSANHLNRHAPSSASSGVLGVCHRPSKPNPWQAYTSAGGRFKSIGYFATKPQAAAARRNYMEQHHG